jgi:hypothetical protein
VQGSQAHTLTLNGSKISIASGRLRNSTKIAARFLGLGHCSPLYPEAIEILSGSFRFGCKDVRLTAPRRYATFFLL